MAVDATQTHVHSAGAVYLNTLDTAAPADLLDATLSTASWNTVGLLGEDGPSASGFAAEPEKLYAWNTLAPVRVSTPQVEPVIAVPLLQWTDQALQLYFPGSSYAAGPPGVVTMPKSPATPTEYALLITSDDGSDRIGLWVPRVRPRGSDDLEFPNGDFSGLVIAFDVLASDTLPDLVKVIGVAAAA